MSCYWHLQHYACRHLVAPLHDYNEISDSLHPVLSVIPKEHISLPPLMMFTFPHSAVRCRSEWNYRLWILRKQSLNWGALNNWVPKAVWPCVTNNERMCSYSFIYKQSMSFNNSGGKTITLETIISKSKLQNHTEIEQVNENLDQCIRMQKCSIASDLLRSYKAVRLPWLMFGHGHSIQCDDKAQQTSMILQILGKLYQYDVWCLIPLL